MGKACKWIKNLLLGKKEEKTNTSNKCIMPSSPTCSTTTTRRWSFRRSNNNTEKVVAVSHKSCRSFDSLITSQALFDYAIQQQKRTTMLPYKAVTAATKIQAAFRSYLAWKALCALRGLVKLQALVRGHLVRKRTTTMVRCMSALVAIQVRARFQRIQMADSRSHLGPRQCEHNENLGQLGSNRQSSRRFSMRLHNKPIDKVSTESKTSRYHNEPNYMTRTKSSRAKARSHSEPRQRPTKQKRENRRTSSNDYALDSASTCTNGSSYYTTLYAYERSEKSY